MGYGLVNAYAAVSAVALRISGPSIICTQATYTIENLPAGVAVQWSASNNNLTLASAQGATAVFGKNGNGACTINANITYGGQTISVSSTIWAGIPSMPSSISGFPNNGQFAAGSQYTLSIDNLNIDEYDWICFGATIVHGQGTNMITIETSNVSGERVVVKVKIRNECGWSPYLIQSGRVNGGIGVFSLSPNPTRNTVTFQWREDIFDNQSTPQPYEIQIWSGIRLIKRFFTHQATYQIPVSDLPDGIYFVHVIKDGNIYREKLMVK